MIDNEDILLELIESQKRDINDLKERNKYLNSKLNKEYISRTLKIAGIASLSFFLLAFFSLLIIYPSFQCMVSDQTTYECYIEKYNIKNKYGFGTGEVGYSVIKNIGWGVDKKITEGKTISEAKKMAKEIGCKNF